MGVLDVVSKPFRTAPPSINPTISADATIVPVGITRNRKQIIGAGVATGVNIGQIYYSTDDCVTWSTGLLATPLATAVIWAQETERGALLLVPSLGVPNIQRVAQSQWMARTPTTTTMTSGAVLGQRKSGTRPGAGWIHSHGEIHLSAEWGTNNSATLDNNGRYAYMSRDEVNWTKVFDIIGAQSQSGLGIGLASSIAAASGTYYHCHAIAYDRWSDRVWLTGGDANAFIAYSDDLSRLSMRADAATTSGSAVVTSAATSGTAFRAAMVGKPIRGTNIPAGTTVLSVDSATQLTMSANATATGSSQVINIGNITWNVLYEPGVNGRYQVTTILPAPEGVYFGSDGFPGGLHFSPRSPNGSAPGVLRNILLIPSPYDSREGGGYYTVGHTAYRADDVLDAPGLMGFRIADQSSATQPGASLVLIHPSGKQAWEIWRDVSNTYGVTSIDSVFHTYNDNIVCVLNSTRTTGGYQILKAAMPKLPSSSAL